MLQQITHLQVRRGISLMRDDSDHTFWRLLSPVGPVDGGCLVVALAMQQVLGGELRGLIDRDGTIHHVYLSTVEGAYDGEGAYDCDEQLLKHWETHHGGLSCKAITARDARMGGCAFNGDHDFQHDQYTLTGWKLVDAISDLLCLHLEIERPPSESITSMMQGSL